MIGVVGSLIALGLIGLLIMILVPVLLSIFWVYMIIDCAVRKFKQPNDKIVWILVIIFTHFVGAFLYYVFVKKKQN